LRIITLILLSLIYISKGFAMNYTDRYGRIHDAPSLNGESSSDNGFFYSAVYKKLGGKVTIDPAVLKYCAENLQRHPATVTNRDMQIPISRDEILGLEYLEPGSTKVLERGWSFSPYKVPAFNPFKLASQVFKLINWSKFKSLSSLLDDKIDPLKHRNTFWKEGYDQIYRFAFSVPISDRHTILQINGKYSMFWHLVHKLTHASKSKNRSVRQLNWFKTGKDLEGVVNYHDAASPIHILAKEKLNGEK
jgi:hypothetical protein